MRIVTYNIHGWRTVDGRPNLDGVARVLAELQADIVGLNEVHYPRAVAGADGPALADLAQRLDMHFVFGPCLRWPAQDNLPANAYGNALLSRWPILASAVHHLTPVEGKEQRGLLEGRILLPGGHSLTVYVTHLDHTDEDARLVQLRGLRAWTVRDRNRPHLVLGDFNAVSLWDFAGREADLAALAAHPAGANLAGGEQGPRVIGQMEKAGYVDVYRRFGPAGQGSFIPAESAIRIDYIFASQPASSLAQQCAIWQAADDVSDHRPVVAEFLDFPG